MESCKSSALMAFMTFDQEGILIICQMLWHETPIFAVLSEFCSFIKKKCPILVAVYDKQGELEIYSELFGYYKTTVW